MTSLEEDVVWELVSDPLSEDEAYALLAGEVAGPLTAAAAPVHTGAMIALVPTDEDLARLAYETGEPMDELHLTLAYLGEAADIPDEMREQIIAAASDYFSNPIATEAFSVNVFNPHDKSMDTALVLGIRGEELAGPRSNVMSAVRGIFNMPANHEPWIPHVTLVYTDDTAKALELQDRLGPLTFDRLRFAFGGEVTDIHLGIAGTLTAAFWNKKKHPRDTAGRFRDADNLDPFHPGIGTKSRPEAPRVTESGRYEDDEEPYTPAPTYEDDDDGDWNYGQLNAVPERRRDEGVQTVETIRNDARVEASFRGAATGKKALAATTNARDVTSSASVREYQTSVDSEVNGSLREGRESSDPIAQMTLRDLDAGMANAKVDRDVAVYRGIRNPRRTFGPAWDSRENNEGLTWQDKGFSSTTASAEVADNFVADSAAGVKMRILVPQGTKALHLPKTEALISDEQEILLNRGLTYRIIRDTKRDKFGIRLIDVEIVPEGGN
jgi:2'-5' RNA ligase